MTDESAVTAAARDVAEAFADHGEVMAAVAASRQESGWSQKADSSEISAVLASGERLREVVLSYERVLSEQTGWSNPVRHLGRLPAYSSGDFTTDRPLDGDRVRVVAEYRLAVGDPEGLARSVEGKGGPSNLDTSAAIRYLVEADGWDPWQYPPRDFQLVDLALTVEIETE